MVVDLNNNYRCENCCKEFTRKWNFDRHIQNLTCKPCKFYCKLCNRKFVSHCSLYRHSRSNCKVKKANDIKKQELYELLLKFEKDNERLTKLEEENKLNFIENKRLKRKIKDMEKIIKKSGSTNIINNSSTTINGNVNIMLVAYGCESIHNIEEKDIIRALSQGYKSTVKLTEAIHFNPDHPEYHNIYITNMKDKYAMKYDGTSWTLIKKDELIDDLYDSKKDYIEENIKDFVEKLNQSSKDALKRWLKSDENQQDPVDADKIKQTKEDLKLLLYNKREIPLQTRESIEQTNTEKI